MFKSLQVSPKYVKGVVVGATLLIFSADWYTWTLINISIFYACVIVSLAWANSLRWLWGWTLLTTILTFLDLSMGNGPGLGYTWVESTNRFITVFMLIVTAGFAHFSILLGRKLVTQERLLTEVAERKRAEESLRKAQDELARISRITTMGELAASIAHEVNQPLSGIVINGNACLRWLATVEGPSEGLNEARQASERIVRDGKRAGDVILRLRNVFKSAPVEKIEVDLNEIIQEVLLLLRPQTERMKVTLQSELQSSLPAVLGDPVQLQQVILNLILNGAEAMETGPIYARKLVIRTSAQGTENVSVEVQDAGVGISPEALEKIFEAFYTSKPGGMGMGLSISRSIVENHGGKLGARANTGPGSTFFFSIPQSC
jgi:signal transduction histidine kinase